MIFDIPLGCEPGGRSPPRCGNASRMTAHGGFDEAAASNGRPVTSLLGHLLCRRPLVGGYPWPLLLRGRATQAAVVFVRTLLVVRTHQRIIALLETSLLAMPPVGRENIRHAILLRRRCQRANNRRGRRDGRWHQLHVGRSMWGIRTYGFAIAGSHSR